MAAGQHAASAVRPISGAVEPGEAGRRFAGPGHEVAAFTIRPAASRDVAIALAHASRHGLAVAFRGAGHAMTAGSIAPGGMLIDNSARPAEMAWREDGIFEVSSSARWVDVEAWLNRHGRTFPVLTDYMGLTVGGTLAVGGYGVRGVAAGCQLDHVREACLILPDGDRRWCSAGRDADLFRVALASAGSLAYIDRVRLDSAPSRDEVRLRTFRHESLVDLAGTLDWTRDASRTWPSQFDATYFRATDRITSRYGDADGRIDWIFEGRGFERRSAIEDRVYTAYPVTNHRHVGAWAERFRGWNRWADYVFDLAALQRALRELDSLRGSATGRFLECVYVVGIHRRPGRFQFAFEASGRRPAPIEFLLGVYYMLPRDESGQLAAVEAEIDRLLALCIQLGGRPYLHGWNRFSADQIDRLYGDDYRTFLRHKRAIDPGSVLPLPFGTRAAARRGADDE